MIVSFLSRPRGRPPVIDIVYDHFRGYYYTVFSPDVPSFQYNISRVRSVVRKPKGRNNRRGNNGNLTLGRPCYETQQYFITPITPINNNITFSNDFLCYIFGRVGRTRVLMSRHRGVLEYGALVPSCRHRARRTHRRSRAPRAGPTARREFSRLHAQTRMCTTAAGPVRVPRAIRRP